MMQNVNGSGIANAVDNGVVVEVLDDGRIQMTVDPRNVLKETDKSVMHTQARWLTVGWDAEGHKVYIDLQCGTSKKIDKHAPKTEQAEQAAPVTPEQMLESLKNNPALLASFLAQLGAGNTEQAPQAPATENNAGESTRAAATGTEDSDVTPRHGLKSDDEMEAEMGAQASKPKRNTRKSGQGKTRGASNGSKASKRGSLSSLVK